MRLENLALEAPRVESDKVYQLVDLAYMSPTGLYGSGDVQLGGGKCIPRFNSDKDLNGEFKPIGSFSDFQKEGPQNISMEMNLGQYAPEAKGFSLTERYDALNDGHSDRFHLNYDLTGINSGTSKKNSDGFKGLGSAHNFPLFDLDK